MTRSLGEGGERLDELFPNAVLVEDVDAREEDLIEDLLNVVVGQAIRARPVLDQVECELQSALDVLKVGAQELRLTSVVRECVLDAVLLALQQVNGNCVRIVRLEESLLLALEFLALGA
ncbi:MAG: hypothetical protein BGO95_04060 [Micrococcales bacterium 73-13]|nr:MAG: hypothetical protein BGO95_04060 [Micrococcales bacterium 73-13]